MGGIGGGIGRGFGGGGLGFGGIGCCRVKEGMGWSVFGGFFGGFVGGFGLAMSRLCGGRRYSFPPCSARDRSPDIS